MNNMDQYVKTKFKLKCVLLELLKSDYKVTDDTILEKLISHLSDKEKGPRLLDVPLCFSWAYSVILSWLQGKSTPAVMSFALRLIAVILENEDNFLYILKTEINTGQECSADSSQNCMFLQQLQEICQKTTKSVSNFSVKCALVQLLSSLLKHTAGRQWILQTGLWKDVYEMSLNDSSVYVVREARRFISSLINSTPSQETDLDAVLSYILQPFYLVPSDAELISDNSRVTATLYVLLGILENAFLTSDPNTNKIQSSVSQLIYKPAFNILQKTLEALKVTKSEEMEEILSKIAVLIHILETVKDGQGHSPDEMKEICLKILNVFNELISKGSVENVLKLCVLCHNYWTYVAKVQRRKCEEDNTLPKGEEKKYRFEDQLLCLQLVPIFCLILPTPSGNHKDLYLYRVFYKICFESQRLVYTFRNMVLQQQRLNYWLEMSVRSVMHLSKVLSWMLPIYVGISYDDPANDLVSEVTEAFIIKLTSLVHILVTRMVYALRTLITDRGCDEQLALISVSSVGQIKHLLNRLTPLCVGCTMGDSTLEEYFQMQISKRIELNVMRSIYTLRDYVVKNRHIMDKSALQSVSTISSLSVRGLDPEIERERAILVFQSFVYVLKHFVLCAESETKQAGWGGELRQSHHSTLLVAILDGLANLVRSHRITWRESVESLCLFTLAQQLLDCPTFISNVGLVVQALHLIQLCIENFMPPNLALLTNTLSGTSFDDLGPLIYKRLHDPHWEVRDSSLEVLLTLATISHTKYPLFQDLILEHKLCEAVVHLALNDAESYVCASATKCLTAMVRVDRLWNEELCDKDLVNKMIRILNGESEGVLRREASLLMSQIFKHRKVQPDVLQEMCVTMSQVVLSDLHWEVKVNALSFWELIIEHQMNNQGMIDGVFPQVTFSKEHRKIVTLTPAAIQERLRKVLSELSQNGCLHVLLSAIHHDEDLEVVKKAAQILVSLSVVLERHNLLNLKDIPASTSNSSEASPSMNLYHVPSLSNQSDSPSGTCSSVSFSWEEEMTRPALNNIGVLNTDIICDDFSKPNQGKSIVDVDPQSMGFAVLEDDGLEVPSVTSESLQDKVIDSILNDRDINLLAKVYLGTGAEVPGRQGPETKVVKPVHPLVIISSNDFLRQLSILKVDKIVDERVRWIEDTGSNLDTLLDDMLITRNVNVNGEADNDCNAMDCY